MGALFAYGPVDFEEFDASATQLLRRGLSDATTGRTWFLRRPLSERDRKGDSPAPMPGHGFAKTMDEVTHEGMDAVLTAADLRTNSLVRFGSAASCSSSHGRIIESVDVTIAVAASTASPLHGRGIPHSFKFDSGGRQRYGSLNLAVACQEDGTTLCQ
jgi:hypothetical protein